MSEKDKKHKSKLLFHGTSGNLLPKVWDVREQDRKKVRPRIFPRVRDEDQLEKT
jgi:hypothetical protein